MPRNSVLPFVTPSLISPAQSSGTLALGVQNSSLTEGTQADLYTYCRVSAQLYDVTILEYPGVHNYDVNGDGIVNTGDAVLILKYAAELVTLDTNQLTLADTTGDGTVNTGDAVLILKYAAGLIEKF